MFAYIVSVNIWEYLENVQFVKVFFCLEYRTCFAYIYYTCSITNYHRRIITGRNECKECNVM